LPERPSGKNRLARSVSLDEVLREEGYDRFYPAPRRAAGLRSDCHDWLWVDFVAEPGTVRAGWTRNQWRGFSPLASFG